MAADHSGLDYFDWLRATARSASELADTATHESLDATTLRHLRRFESSLARAPHPTVARPDHSQYYRLPLPEEREVYISQFLTERGLETGIELFPERLEDWHFVHPETQYCTGGASRLDVVTHGGIEDSYTLLPGSVYVIPAGAMLSWLPAERPTAHRHANVYVMNGPVYYDELHLARFASLGVVPDVASHEIPDLAFHDITDRIEITDWAQLLTPHPDQRRDLPSWMRNGWKHREITRALDYAERDRSFVISGPDRPVSDYIDWGTGRRNCAVNPLICEPISSVVDCLLPSGYHVIHPENEIWHVLSGSATLRQSIAPLHGTVVDQRVTSGDVAAIAGGSNLWVDETEGEFVVRRMASSCAHNLHVQMMEAKLRQHGLFTEV